MKTTLTFLATVVGIMICAAAWAVLSMYPAQEGFEREVWWALVGGLFAPLLLPLTRALREIDRIRSRGE